MYNYISVNTGTICSTCMFNSLAIISLYPFSPPHQPPLSFHWMLRTNAWRRLRTVACTRNVVHCGLSMYWPVQSGCREVTAVANTSATGPCGASWSGYQRSTAWVCCSVPVPTPYVERGGEKPSYPPAPTRRWREHSPTASISGVSAVGMTSAGESPNLCRWGPETLQVRAQISMYVESEEVILRWGCETYCLVKTHIIKAGGVFWSHPSVTESILSI